jgi:hypothetical protein
MSSHARREVATPVSGQWHAQMVLRTKARIIADLPSQTAVRHVRWGAGEAGKPLCASLRAAKGYLESVEGGADRIGSRLRRPQLLTERSLSRRWS